MNDIKINFLGQEPDPSKKRLFFFLKIFGSVLASLILLVIFTTSNSGSGESLISRVPILRQMNRLMHSADRALKGQEDDRINILLLGMGGVRHDGPFLTDTIILASIKPSTKQISLVSIPRDLAVNIPDYGWYKVNHTNSFGETRNSGSGGEFVRNTLSSAFDIPIQYYIRVDFDGFVNLIDNLGGIDVYVERNFVDNMYPTNVNGNVKTVYFETGWEHMDGDRALTYARSRHGSSGEGSDFARARRQQKILEALKDKVFSLGTLRSPQRISSVIESLKESIRTNFSPWELLTMSRLSGSLNTDHIITRVLQDGPDGELVATTGSDGAYLLVPRENDWSGLQSLIENVFNDQNYISETSRPTKPIRIELQNGTRITGLGAKTADALKKDGFEVTKISNAEERNRPRTIIYDLSNGKYPDALIKLKNDLNADISMSLPGWILNDEIFPKELQIIDTPSATAATLPDTDFLIILGSDIIYGQ